MFRQQNLTRVLNAVLINQTLDGGRVLIDFPIAPLHRTTLKLLGRMNKQAGRNRHVDD